MVKKERKKIHGSSNNDKPVHYIERFKSQCPNFEMTNDSSLNETDKTLGTMYSEFQLSQRPKWVKLQSQFVDLNQYDELKKSFVKTPFQSFIGDLMIS